MNPSQNAKCKMQNAKSRTEDWSENSAKKQNAYRGQRFSGVEPKSHTVKIGFCFSKRLQSCLILHFAFCILNLPAKPQYTPLQSKNAPEGAFF